jgi:hypothetical protein
MAPFLITPAADAPFRVELRADGLPLAWYPVSAMRDALAHFDAVTSELPDDADVRVVLIDGSAGDVTLASTVSRLAA